MSRKRPLENKEGDSPAKRVRIVSDKKDGPSGKKPMLSKEWTRTDPVTGEQGRLHRKDTNYIVNFTRRQKHIKKKKAKKSAEKKKKTSAKAAAKAAAAAAAEETKSDDEEASPSVADGVIPLVDLTRRYEGHVCVVTGGGSSLGQAIAVRFAQEGGIVYVADKKKWKETLDVIKKDCPKSDCEGVRLNVTDTDAIKKFVNKVIDERGYIDVLVNAAAIHTSRSDGLVGADVDPKEIEKVYQVNVTGMMNVCREIIPHMVDEKYGRVVNLAHLAGKVPAEGELIQSMTSGAIMNATTVLGRDYARSGVTVNCLAVTPFMEGDAFVETTDPKEAKKNVPIGRVAELGEMAGVAAFIASEENSYTTAHLYDCSGGNY